LAENEAVETYPVGENESVAERAARQVLHLVEKEHAVEITGILRGDVPGIDERGALDRVVAPAGQKVDLGSSREPLDRDDVVKIAGGNVQFLHGRIECDRPDTGAGNEVGRERVRMSGAGSNIGNVQDIRVPLSQDAQERVDLIERCSGRADVYRIKACTRVDKGRFAQAQDIDGVVTPVGEKTEPGVGLIDSKGFAFSVRSLQRQP
jgi:hypothetical protein